MYFSAVNISFGIIFRVRKLRRQRSERRGRADLGTLKLWHLKFHGRAQLCVACSYLGFNFDCISADREASCSTGKHTWTTCQYSRLSPHKSHPFFHIFLPLSLFKGNNILYPFSYFFPHLAYFLGTYREFNRTFIVATLWSKKRKGSCMVLFLVLVSSYTFLMFPCFMFYSWSQNDMKEWVFVLVCCLVQELWKSTFLGTLCTSI